MVGSCSVIADQDRHCEIEFGIEAAVAAVENGNMSGTISSTPKCYPLDYPVILDLPKRLTEVPSWHFHMPFAQLLVAMLRPSVFVELGTHKGDSYCCFCQAVEKIGTKSYCYAVDTWQGDEHAGAYDAAETLADLQAYHDPLYGRFSSLIQSTFDDALFRFEDGSIDLLHIDGLHTYEAVKHDFEAWLPKLSSRGVVLFHDTNVRERNFGVWKLWEELQARYPSKEFKFGHGLGVLGVGKHQTPKVEQFFKADATAWEAIEALFLALGERCSAVGASNHLAKKVDLLAEQIERIKAAQSLTCTQLKASEMDRASIQAQLISANQRIDAVHSSTSWRMTRPVRWLKHLATKAPSIAK